MQKAKSYLEKDSDSFDKSVSPIESEMWFDSETGEFSDFQLMPFRAGGRKSFAAEEDEEEILEQSISLVESNMGIPNQEYAIPIQDNCKWPCRKITYEEMKDADPSSYDLKVISIIDKNLCNGISPSWSSNIWVSLINSQSSLNSHRHYNRDRIISTDKFARYVHLFMFNDIYMVDVTKNWYNNAQRYRFIKKGEIINNKIDFGIRDEETRKECNKRDYQKRKEQTKKTTIIWKKNNPDKVKESDRNYKENHPDRIKEGNKKYYSTHRAEILKQKKVLRLRNGKNCKGGLNE